MENKLQLATEYLYKPIKGRYVTLEQVTVFLKTLHVGFSIQDIGRSELGKKITSINFGQGETKIMIWSQMHGNESTTTKGLLDFLNFCNIENTFFYYLYSNFTICVIPMLNPDGAKSYTRENANQVDLNRDAYNCTQSESKVLRQVIESFQPDYCFNLHDQRTIFGLLETKKPATMSFLTAAYNEARDFNETRIKAARVINGIVKNLEKFIPGQIGRFDDTFNINCTGDYYMSQGIPTILFEAGHFKNDYLRDEVRKYVFISLLSAFYHINENDVVEPVLENYLNIFQNNKCFVDIIFKNLKIFENNVEKIINFAVQFTESLIDDKVEFIGKIHDISDLNPVYGHFEFDCNNKLFSSVYGGIPKIGAIADFYVGDYQFINGKLVS